MKSKWMYVYAFPIVVSVGVGIGVLCFLLPTNNGTQRSKLVDCGSDLRLLGMALDEYAADNEGAFPNDFETIVEYAHHINLLICPSADPEVFSVGRDWSRIAPTNTCRYYVAGGSDESRTADQVQMFCPPELHKGRGGNILFMGGYVKWFFVESDEEETFWAELQSSGITPEMVAAATNKIIHVDDLKLD